MMNRGRGVVRTLFGLATSIALLGSIGCSNDSDEPFIKNPVGDPPPLTAELIATDADASESGDTATFTITLSELAPSDFNIYYEESWKSTAAPDIDYEKLSGSAHIAAGEDSVDITVIPIDDDQVDGVETVTIYLVYAPQGEAFQYAMGTNDEATIRIQSDDAPQATITTSTETISENGDIGSFVITLSELTIDDVAVKYQVMTKSTATSGVDFEELEGTVIVQSGNRTAEIQIEPINDNLFESDETVQIELLSLGSDYEAGYPNTATLTITSEELPAVDIEAIDARATENGNKGAFRVSIAASLNDDLVIQYEVSGTATNGIDYDSLINNIIILAGETNAKIDVVPIQDDEEESPEYVTLTIAPNTSYHLGAIDEATVTIFDYAVPFEMPMVTLKATDDTANENGDTASFEISIDQELPHDLTVQVIPLWDTDGNMAMPGIDYVQPPHKVTIPKGYTSTTIIITPIKDSITEPEEMVMLYVIPGPGYGVNFLGIDAGLNRIARITGDESIPRVRLISRDATATENGDTASFTVELDQSRSVPTTVYYEMDARGDSAEWGQDVEFVPGSITIPAGETSATQIVTAVDDNLPEGKETLSIELTPDPNYSIEQKSFLVFIDIISDETQPLVTLEATDNAASERGLDPATFVVSLDMPASEDLYINLYTGIGDAKLGIDYVIDARDPLVIRKGETSAEITIVPIDDSEPESLELIGIILEPGPGYTIDGLSSVTPSLAYLESDEIDSTPLVIATDLFASESGNDVATFRILLNQPAQNDMNYTCRWDGTAEQGVDYGPLPTEVTIQTGESHVDINVVALDDGTVEGPETVRLVIHEASMNIFSSLAEVFVMSDDEGPVARLVITDPVAHEAGQVPATCTVILDRPAPTDITIHYSHNGYPVRYGTDYRLSTEVLSGYTETGSLVIPKGEVSGEIQVIPIDDTDVEDVEKLRISLDGGEDYIVGNNRVGDIYITSDDTSDYLVNIVAIQPIAREGGADAVFEISLTKPATTDLRIYYSTVRSSSNPEFESFPLAITMEAGQTSIQVTVKAIDDDEPESVEELEIRLSHRAGYDIGPNDRIKLYIESDE